jgi:hypothetical protein
MTIPNTIKTQIQSCAIVRPEYLWLYPTLTKNQIYSYRKIRFMDTGSYVYFLQAKVWVNLDHIKSIETTLN